MHLFPVRLPIDRAISIYYFWGEIRKQYEVAKGNATFVKGTEDKHFFYHGDPFTSPTHDIAISYAKNLPYNVGMPGPSFSWSAFGSTLENGIEYLKVGHVSPLILERLDESLVVLSHYLGWSLADVVIVKPRKALSQHPGAKQWPQDAITLLRNQLTISGEYEFYEAADALLSSKIAAIKADNVDFDGEVFLLKALRTRATEVSTYDIICP